MNRLFTVIVTNGIMTTISLVAGARDQMRFTAGEASTAEKFGSVGPVLLTAGCIAILVIFAMLIWSQKQSRRLADRLDAVEAAMNKGAPDDDA